MLDATRCPDTRLIAGGYATRGGGVCPLLASHRRGGRSHDQATASSRFADVWDRYTATPTGERRVVDPAHRGALEAMLTASLARERRRRAEAELARAAAELRSAEAERGEREIRTLVTGARRALGARVAEAVLDLSLDRSRMSELGTRSGWAWLGVYRRYDDYRAALAGALNAERAGQAPDPKPKTREAELVG